MCVGKQYTKLDSLIYENGKKDGDGGHIVTMYENNRCGLRVVLCKIPGAMCSLEIIVPTLATDDKGTAHALEHLVLRGSKHYPHCGYLTAFMQRNYCAGRNGMTCADHTVYVASAISEEAIGRLLPVYLDHVINPLLDPQQLPTQVYQVNEQGHEGGVVYNEMLSREDKPDDIAIHTMLKKLYPDHSPYAYYPGGYTGLLSSITHKEIVDFHSEFYDPCNITVVIAGSVTEEHIISEVLEKIPSDRFTTQFKSTWGRHCLHHQGEIAPSTQVAYAAGDNAQGQVYYGWRGPQFEDELHCNAYNVLGEYLTQRGSGPLNTRLAGGTNPVAASVFMGVYDALPTCLYLSLQGIQKPNFNLLAADDTTLKDIVRGALRSAHHSSSLLDDIHVAIKSVRARHLQKFEDTPHEELKQLVRYDIVSAHWSGGPVGSSMRTFSVLDELADKDSDFWINLIEVLADDEMCEVKLIPDIKKDDDEGASITSSETCSIPEYGCIRGGWTELTDMHISSEICEQMDAINIPDISEIPAATSYVACPHASNPRPFDYIQSVRYDSYMARVHMQLSMAELPLDLWPYVPILEWALLTSDLAIPGSIASTTDPALASDSNGATSEIQLRSYQKNNSVETDIRIGFTDDGFELGWLGDYMVVTGVSPAANAGQMVRSLLLSLFFARFTEDNTLNMVNQMKSIIAHRKLSTAHLIRDISSSILHSRARSARMHVDIFHQQAVLKDVGRKLTLGSSGEKARILQNLTKGDQERQGKILEKLACSVADGKGGQLDMLANRIRSQKDAIISTLTNGSEHEKKQVLDRIYDELAKAAQPSKSEILDKLNRIKRHLLKGCAGRGLHSGIVTLGIPSGYDIGFSAESFVAEWDAMAAASSVSPSALLLPFVSSEHPLNLLKQVHANMPKLQESVAVHAIVKSEKSAYWRITVPCVVARYPGDIGSLDVDALPLPLPAKDHYAMVLLAHILGANEGLLSNAIRDKGLGYSPKLLYDSTMQTCTLVCNKTSDIGEAYDALKTALLGIRSSWDQQIDRFKLEVARSVALFKQVSSVSKPSRLLVAAAEACLQGFADINAKHRWANEHLRAVTLDDLRHVFNTFVMPLVDREQSPAITVVISSDDSCSGIGEQALESKQLEALFDWISG